MLCVRPGVFEVRANPFDSARIEKLLNLEKQAGDFAMVHYLEGRLQSPEGEKTKAQEKKL